MKNKKALIIVDVQYDFLPNGNLAVAGGDEVIPVINELVKKFDLVIFTQDFHPANHESFASQHEGKSPFEKIKLNGEDQILWPDHCIQRTRGCSIHESVMYNPELAEKRFYIFKKGLDQEVDSYSGFYDNGRAHSTGLNEFLQDEGVESLYITGLALDYCVAWTAKDAVKLGFETFVVLDGTKSIDPEYSTSDMEISGIKIIQSQDVSLNQDKIS